MKLRPDRKADRIEKALEQIGRRKLRWRVAKKAAVTLAQHAKCDVQLDLIERETLAAHHNLSAARGY